MANNAPQALKTLVRGVGDIAGIDLATEIMKNSVLPRANGGTGVAESDYTDGQVLIGATSTGSAIPATITGTANQVVVTNGANSITLSLPQSINTSASPTFAGLTTTGLTSANITAGASVKQCILKATASPGGGVACANGTVYFGFIPILKACTLKAVSYQTHVDPVSGTNVIKVLKNGASGNTVLSVASASLNGATADTAQNPALTATGADKSFVAGDNIYFEYSAGTQGAAAKDVVLTVQLELTDF
jgi:hypothetical protein